MHVFQTCNSLPLIMVGDFNLIRSIYECNKEIEFWWIKEVEMPDGYHGYTPAHPGYGRVGDEISSK